MALLEKHAKTRLAVAADHFNRDYKKGFQFLQVWHSAANLLPPSTACPKAWALREGCRHALAEGLLTRPPCSLLSGLETPRVAFCRPCYLPLSGSVICDKQLLFAGLGFAGRGSGA